MKNNVHISITMHALVDLHPAEERSSRRQPRSLRTGSSSALLLLSCLLFLVISWDYQLRGLPAHLGVPGGGAIGDYPMAQVTNPNWTKLHIQ